MVTMPAIVFFVKQNLVSKHFLWIQIDPENEMEIGKDMLGTAAEHR